ncbi:FAD/NAD(P)-binding domain-containing protein [Trichoderma barbatum]
MSTRLVELYAATGVQFVRGIVDVIRTADQEVEMVDHAGERSTLFYNKLILAAGSRLTRPNISGLQEYAFNIDTIDNAADFEAHLHRLAALPPTPARDTVVVCGGGFTGLELAAELPGRLRKILGIQAKVRVIIIERSDVIASGLGANPRPIIIKALEDLQVETKVGVTVTSINASGVVTSTGEQIDALSVVWAGGMEATPLTKQIPGEKDGLGRLHVDSYLRVPSCRNVFASGDAAYAKTDDKGHYALMSCQHARPLGNTSGYNAAAELLGLDVHLYAQPTYGVILDLGGWGSLYCDGWDYKVLKSGGMVKELKNWVNRSLISPPRADAAEAFATADPSLGPTRERFSLENIL